MDRGRTDAAPTNGETVEETAATKSCPDCGELKALELFGKNPKKKDGLQSICCDCVGEYYRDRALAAAETESAPQDTPVDQEPSAQPVITKGKGNG